MSAPLSAESCPPDKPQLGQFTGSQVEFFGLENSHCGYCKGANGIGDLTRHSYDMKLVRILPADYQALLDMNWRRSGCYCYLPLNWNTCCPHYGISCKTDKFILTASLRRVVENMNTFLYTGSTSDKLKLDYSKTPIFDKLRCVNDCDKPQEALTKRALEKLAESTKAKDRRFLKACEKLVASRGVSLGYASRLVKERSMKRRNNYTKFVLEQYLYPAKVSLSSMPDDYKKTLPKKPVHQLVIRLVHTESQEAKSMYAREHQLLQKYQQAVHKESASEWSSHRFYEFLVRSPIVVEPMKNRHHVVHDEDNDTLSRKWKISNHRGNLNVEPPELPTCYGSYHCMYLLDNELIGVGLLDVLPKCVTTVYFFYDPDYQHLNMGLYSALVEISLVRQLNSQYNGPKEEKDPLVHYYLGFYLQVCKKMHYKTRFKPSYLLDCISYRYIPTQECLPKLRQRKYARFYSDVNDCLYIPSSDDILQVPVLSPISAYMMTMTDYLKWVESNLGSKFVEHLVNEVLSTYVRLIGKRLAARMLFRMNYYHNFLINKRDQSQTAAASSKTRRRL